MALERAVNVGNEFRQTALTVAGPVFREEMIVADVEHDAGVATAVGAEQLFARLGHGVAVRERVDFSMENDPVDHPATEAAGRPALDEIADETADQKLVVVIRQKSVGQVVHLVSTVFNRRRFP